jgi:hypothetical protein
VYIEVLKVYIEVPKVYIEVPNMVRHLLKVYVEHTKSLSMLTYFLRHKKARGMRDPRRRTPRATLPLSHCCSLSGS